MAKKKKAPVTPVTPEKKEETPLKTTPSAPKDTCGGQSSGQTPATPSKP